MGGDLISTLSERASALEFLAVVAERDGNEPNRVFFTETAFWIRKAIAALEAQSPAAREAQADASVSAVSDGETQNPLHALPPAEDH